MLKLPVAVAVLHVVVHAVKVVPVDQVAQEAVVVSEEEPAAVVVVKEKEATVVEVAEAAKNAIFHTVVKNHQPVVAILKRRSGSNTLVYRIKKPREYSRGFFNGIYLIQ